ncbi:glycosyltransferase family 2 protein [Escherichia coli]|nr:glycosyltransferase family 2 protein [Escherichia coli]
MTNFSDVGIGIISYNRSEYLEKCLKSIYNSNINGAEVVVFDDHSQDNSFFIAKKYGKVVSPQSNGGVVRNKNRALYYFTETSPKKYIILLEEDVYVDKADWLEEWVDATEKYGHMNYSAPWFLHESLKHHLVSGEGNSNTPHIFKVVTGQCSSVKSSLIKETVGYLDPRFLGFGCGHVEWTNRLIAKKQGGYFINGEGYYMAIRGGIVAPPSPSHKNNDELSKNSQLFHEMLKRGFDNRVLTPWKDEEEKQHHFSNVIS